MGRNTFDDPLLFARKGLHLLRRELWLCEAICNVIDIANSEELQVHSGQRSVIAEAFTLKLLMKEVIRKEDYQHISEEWPVNFSQSGRLLRLCSMICRSRI